jgi:archaellum component FlaF (FlaF/FlaG flagellin family)
VVVSGTVNYTIQHTFDDIFDASVTPVWFNHPTIASLAVNADGNYAFPVRAIKVLVNSGAGTATLTAIQAGMPGK